MKQLELDFSKIKTYRSWAILDEIPEGWVVDKTAGSPVARSVFITNGKSPISGQQKRALLKVKPTIRKKDKPVLDSKSDNHKINELEKEYVFPAKSVNELARARFKEQLLKDIMFDMMVCEIEGWDKLDYINELKSLINSINTNRNQK